MLRLLEISLFLAPFAAFGAWRLLAPGGGPSRRVVAVAAGALLLLAGALLWLSRDQALPPGSTYVPAQLRGGTVVPAHGTP